MNNSRILLHILLALAALSGSACAEQKVVEVPQIGNMSEAEAVQMLERIGLTANFKDCFSATIEKYSIVPGSQDPKEGTKLLSGREVSAVVSQGLFPNVVGLSENEAKDLIDKANLKNEIIYDRNITYKEGLVFKQEPKEATCLSSDFTVKIYVNRPLTIEIKEPKENVDVGSAPVVRGSLSSDLTENESLWIAVKPLNNIKDWWPQNNLPKLVPVNKEFEGNAFLGGNKGDKFEIGILVVGEDINETFMEWLNTSLRENNWPSITQGRPGTNQKVAKEVIEAHKLAKVDVVLNQ